MKSKTWVYCLLALGIAVSATAQDTPAAKGKALVEAKKCAICHKEGGKGKPMGKLTEGRSEDYLKGSITDPKKTIGPQTTMPAYKFTDEELQSVVAYLHSVAGK